MFESSFISIQGSDGKLMTNYKYLIASSNVVNKVIVPKGRDTHSDFSLATADWRPATSDKNRSVSPLATSDFRQ